MSLKRLTLIWILVILLAVVPSKQASVREGFPKGASGSAPRQAEGKTANQNPQFGNSVQNPAIRDADRGNSSISRGVPDAALSPKVEDFKNYSGWRILRVYPPDAVALDDLVAMLLDMSQLVVLGIFKEKMVVEVALPGNATLDEAMPESRFSFCGFDGQRKGGSLLRGKGEMCGSDASGKDIGNSTSGSDVGKEVVGWETLKTIEDDYATKLDGTEPFAWDNFYRYESIVTFIKELALQYSGVEYIEIGRSVEGRSLYALLFAKKAKSLKKKYLRNIKKERRRNKTGRKPFPKLKNSTGRNKKPVVLMEGAAHAREWISPAVATYLAQQLADSGKTFLKRVTVILVPVLNPDGYEYSHTTDRLWRKNRRPNSGSGCTGVDLNRNFDMAFGNPSGSSDDPCSPIYHGAEAFSEPETSALRDLAGAFSKDVNIYISLHSYGKLIMYPWSYIYGSAPNRKQLKDVARKMSRHFKNNGYKGFLHGQSSSLLYKASGVSDDYMYSVGVDYSYTIELQGLDFIMKPKHIVPVSEAMWNTLVCSIGDISNTKAVKRFCGKRLVKTTLGDGATASGWFRRRVSLRRAEQIIRCKNLAKKRGISSDSDDSCKYRKGKRTHNKR